MLRCALLLSLASLAACFTDTASSGDGCADGDAACPCFSNGTCNGVLVCDAGTGRCVGPDCQPGMDGCPCENGSCDGPLVCVASGLCASEDPQATDAGTTTSSLPLPTTTLDPTAATNTESTTATVSSTGVDPDTATNTTVGDSSSTGERKPPEGTLVLYQGGAPKLGDLGGAASPPADRAQVDAFCNSMPPECTAGGHALLTIDGLDLMRQLPVLFSFPHDAPVVGPETNANPVQIAESFDQLIDGPLADSLIVANVTNEPRIWTGTRVDGGLAPETCDGWTSTSENLEGRAADPTTASEGWIGTIHQRCDEPAALICVCWWLF